LNFLFVLSCYAHGVMQAVTFEVEMVIDLRGYYCHFMLHALPDTRQDGRSDNRILVTIRRFGLSANGVCFSGANG